MAEGLPPEAIEAATEILLAARNGDSPDALAPYLVEKLTPLIRARVLQEAAEALNAEDLSERDLGIDPADGWDAAADFVEVFGKGER